MMKQFPTANMDRNTLISTFIVGGICVAISGYSLYEIITQKVWVLVVPISIIIGALTVTFFLVPKIFVDDDRNIYVKNSFVNFVIKRNEIKSIGKIEVRKFNIRTFGAGGFLGYFGYFNGNDVWYVTNIDKKVKITMNSGKIYMLSPENRDEFINDLEK